MRAYHEHSGEVTDLCFDDSAEYLASSSSDGSVVVRCSACPARTALASIPRLPCMPGCPGCSAGSASCQRGPQWLGRGTAAIGGYCTACPGLRPPTPTPHPPGVWAVHRRGAALQAECARHGAPYESRRLRCQLACCRLLLPSWTSVLRHLKAWLAVAAQLQACLLPTSPHLPTRLWRWTPATPRARPGSLCMAPPPAPWPSAPRCAGGSRMRAGSAKPAAFDGHASSCQGHSLRTTASALAAPQPVCRASQWQAHPTLRSEN